MFLWTIVHIFLTTQGKGDEVGESEQIDLKHVPATVTMRTRVYA